MCGILSCDWPAAVFSFQLFIFANGCDQKQAAKSGKNSSATADNGLCLEGLHIFRNTLKNILFKFNINTRTSLSFELKGHI